MPLQRAWDATSEAETQARADIAWTEPTTMAGVVAALNHIRTMTEKGERLFDDHNDALGFLYSIEASVRSIAGMPPIDGADEKAEVEHA